MKIEVCDSLLIAKYNKPVPRYTSYPTVPSWNKNIDTDQWKTAFAERFGHQNHVSGISLYIHLPFCESLCTYCGCNKKITSNHAVEEEYILAVQQEWQLYRRLMTQTPVIRALHLGGGTPTFFSPENLRRLVSSILKGCVVHPGREFSIEGHPNNTSPEHLKVLSSLGFTRISYGVQDNDPGVQQAINRIQPLEKLIAATENAKACGFRSINFDLIYGLPLQTVKTIETTIGQVVALKPDRIAFYSYAHVPWASRAQRLFDEADLPNPQEKLRLYIKGKEFLTDAGYFDIGMDHFSLPSDDLYKARMNGKLHRNFMGYTTQYTGLVLGLGVSAISDAAHAYAQNEKTLHGYYSLLNEGHLPIVKGCMLSQQDMSIKKYILDICCKGKTAFNENDMVLLQRACFPKLAGLMEDGLIKFNVHSLQVTDLGQHFIRNICSAFDLYLNDTNNNNAFSKAI